MLTDEEKNAALRTKDKLLKELPYQEYLKEYAQLMLLKGLEANYLKQRAEFELKLRDAESQIFASHEAIRLVDDQVLNGVESQDDALGGMVLG